jgi:hypothetical protein
MGKCSGALIDSITTDAPQVIECVPLSRVVGLFYVGELSSLLMFVEMQKRPLQH